MSTLSFKSPAGTSYTVNIGKGSYTLIGAPEPFVIQEDDDTNAFLPIRKTTGYVRFIVNDSSQWENLIPTSATDVTVECSDCHFFGFALPQSYGGSFAYGPSEFSLAIGCPLCALASMKLDYDDNTSNNEVSGLISFSDLLDLLVAGFDQNMGIHIDYNAIGTYSGQNVSTLEVQWQLLFEDSEDGSTFTPKYNNLEILEKICTFFGVTARCIDNEIKLIKPDNHDIQPISVSDFLLADTGSTIEIEQGVGLVKTRAQVSDSATFEFSLDRVIEKVMNEPNLYALALPDNPNDQQYSGQKSVKYYLSTSQFVTTDPEYADVPDNYEFNDVQFNFANGTNQKLYLFANEDKRYYGYPIDVYNKSWRGLLRHTQILDPSIPVIGFGQSSCFNCKKKYYFSGGYFKLSGRCFNFDWKANSDYQEETPGVLIDVILRVGNQYFDGQDFKSNFAVFQIWAKDGMLGKGYYNVPDVPFWGLHFDQDYIIPVKGNLEGKVSLGIGPVLDAGEDRDQVFFEDISLEYHRDRGYRNQTSKTYPQEGGNFSNTIEFDSFFASDSERLKYGLELIVKSGGGFYGSDSTEVPIEQLTAERIAQFGTTSRRVLTLNLREGDALYGKGIPFWIVYDNYTYYAISISQNPAKGVYTVKFI